MRCCWHCVAATHFICRHQSCACSCRLWHSCVHDPCSTNGRVWMELATLLPSLAKQSSFTGLEAASMFKAAAADALCWRGLRNKSGICGTPLMVTHEHGIALSKRRSQRVRHHLQQVIVRGQSMCCMCMSLSRNLCTGCNKVGCTVTPAA